MKAENYSERVTEISGVRVRITTYKIDKQHYCKVANVDPGAMIARGEGASKEEAERIALEKASRRIK